MKKTQRKILALVLVVVMALSMIPFAALADNGNNGNNDYDNGNANGNGANDAAPAPVAAGAPTRLEDFADADAINPDFVEAFDTLTALRVYRGVASGGVFNLETDRTITRAEITTLIARIYFGIAATEAVEQRSTHFSDVGADHWASGYIHLLHSAGLVAGVGDGRFDPAREVTHVEAVTMMLRALGYGPSGNFTGSGWDAYAVSTARAIGIFPDVIAIDVNTPAQRGNVGLYIFNTITIPDTVTWNAALSRYVSWSEGIGLGIGQDVAVRSLGEQVFGLVENATNVDPLGWRVRQWDIRTVGDVTRALTGNTFPAYNMVGDIVTDGTATILPATGQGLAQGAWREYFVNGWEYVVPTTLTVLGAVNELSFVGAAGTPVVITYVDAAGARRTANVRVYEGAQEVRFFSDSAIGFTATGAQVRLDVVRYLATFRGVEVARTVYAESVPVITGGFIIPMMEAATRQVSIERYVIIARQGARVTGAPATSGANTTVPGLIAAVPGAVPNLINEARPDNDTGGVLTQFVTDNLTMPANLVANDFVLYVTGRDNQTFIDRADSVSGRVTSPSIVYGTATFDGVQFRSSQLGLEVSIDRGNRFETFGFRDVEITGWLDKGGNIFALTPGIPAAMNYLVVVGNIDIDSSFTRGGTHRVQRARASVVLLSGGGVISAHLEQVLTLAEWNNNDANFAIETGTIFRYTQVGDFRVVTIPGNNTFLGLNTLVNRSPRVSGALNTWAANDVPATVLQNQNTPFQAGTTVFVTIEQGGANPERITVHRGILPVFPSGSRNIDNVSILRSLDDNRHARFVFMEGTALDAPGWYNVLVMAGMGWNPATRELNGLFNADTGARISGESARLTSGLSWDTVRAMYSATNQAGFNTMLLQVQRDAGDNISAVRLNPGLVVGWGSAPGVLPGTGVNNIGNPGNFFTSSPSWASNTVTTTADHTSNLFAGAGTIGGSSTAGGQTIWMNRLFNVANATTAPLAARGPINLDQGHMWMGIRNVANTFTHMFVVNGNTGLPAQLNLTAVAPPPTVDISDYAFGVAVAWSTPGVTPMQRMQALSQLRAVTNFGALADALAALDLANPTEAQLRAIVAAAQAIVTADRGDYLPATLAVTGLRAALAALIYDLTPVPPVPTPPADLIGYVSYAFNAASEEVQDAFIEALEEVAAINPLFGALAAALEALQDAENDAAITAAETAMLTALRAIEEVPNLAALMPTATGADAIRSALMAVIAAIADEEVAPVPVPSASVPNTTINATANTALAANNTFTITLAGGARFVAADAGAAAWITGLPAGLTATHPAIAADATEVVVTIGGTPTTANAPAGANLTISIPPAATNQDAALAVTGTVTVVVAAAQEIVPELYFWELGGGAFNVRVTSAGNPMPNVMVIFAVGNEWSEGGLLTNAEGVSPVGASQMGITHVLLVTPEWTGDRDAFWTGLEEWVDPAANANLTFGSVDGKYVITGPFSHTPA